MYLNLQSNLAVGFPCDVPFMQFTGIQIMQKRLNMIKKITLNFFSADTTEPNSTKLKFKLQKEILEFTSLNKFLQIIEENKILSKIYFFVIPLRSINTSKLTFRE